MNRTIQKEAQRKMGIKNKQGIGKLCDNIDQYNKYIEHKKKRTGTEHKMFKAIISKMFSNLLTTM